MKALEPAIPKKDKENVLEGARLVEDVIHFFSVTYWNYPENYFLRDILAPNRNTFEINPKMDVQVWLIFEGHVEFWALLK